MAVLLSAKESCLHAVCTLCTLAYYVHELYDVIVTTACTCATANHFSPLCVALLVLLVSDTSFVLFSMHTCEVFIPPYGLAYYSILLCCGVLWCSVL